MQLGKTIEALRKKRKIKQGALADAAGISQTYLCLLEKDLKAPTTSTLQKIAEALQTSLPLLMLLTIEECDMPETDKGCCKMLLAMGKGLVYQNFA